MKYYDQALKTYADSGLRTAQDWASIGRDVKPESKPRIDTVHRGVAPRTEDNLRGRRAKKISHRQPGAGDHRVGFSARRVIPVRIRVMAVEVVGHGLDNRARRLRTAGAVKICHW